MGPRLMIPLDKFTEEPAKAEFLYPYGAGTRLSEQVWGGVAISDPSMGRSYQLWTVSAPSDRIIVGIGSSTEMTLVTGPVESCSLAFDANMAPAICYQQSGAAHLYYHDSYTNSWVTMDVPATSCLVRNDDVRDVVSDASDCIFAYTAGDQLFYRVEREHYAVEHLVGAVPSGWVLAHMGPNLVGRFQFQLQVAR